MRWCFFVVCSAFFFCACPRAVLEGSPCTPDDAPEACEGPVKLRCDGQVYIRLADCAADCVEGEGKSHEQEQIANNTTWACLDGPHIVTGVVNVLPGATLTLETGAAVRVDPSSRIDVDPAAKVVVDAVAGAPVLMTSNNGQAAGFGSSTSGGLNVFAAEDEGGRSILRHFIVERGIHGLGVFGLSDTKLPPIIENSTFRDNENFGIKVACDGDTTVPDFAAADTGNQFFENGAGDVSGCE